MVVAKLKAAQRDSGCSVEEHPIPLACTLSLFRVQSMRARVSREGGWAAYLCLLLPTERRWKLQVPRRHPCIFTPPPPAGKLDFVEQKGLTAYIFFG